MRLRAVARPWASDAPKSSIEPELGRVMPVTMRMSVDFPGAVLADEPVDAPRLEVEVDGAEDGPFRGTPS